MIITQPTGKDVRTIKNKETRPKKVTAMQRKQQKPAQSVTTNISYSQIASTPSTKK